MMSECNLKRVGGVLLFANTSKVLLIYTRHKNQGLHIAFVLGVSGLERTGKHISCHMTYGVFYI